MSGKVLRLKELAEQLGLSRTTVSRALNGFPEVNEETRVRVQAAAERLGYQPNAVARKLATGRTGVIGVVFPPLDNFIADPHFIEWLAGTTSWCSEKGIILGLTDTTKVGEVESYRRIVASRQVDGLIVTTPGVDDPRIRFLIASGFPFLVHGRSPAIEQPYAFMDIDNHGAFYRASRLLLDLGHTRIAFINGMNDRCFAHMRDGGYRAALGERGVAVDERLQQNLAMMTEEGGYRASVRCLEAPSRPTAFLCSSVVLASGCLRALRDSGLRVPADCSVIAHDDVLRTHAAESYDPPLTTTRSSITAAGRRCAELMFAVIEGQAVAGIHDLWPVDLVLRDSTAPPPR